MSSHHPKNWPTSKIIYFYILILFCMQFVFCILFFKQFDAFEKVFSKCFNKFDVHSFIISNLGPLQGGGGGGGWSTPKIMYFISSLILLMFFPSDLPVVLMILRERKKSKSEPKRIRKESEQMWQTWINSMGRLLRRFLWYLFGITIIQHN